MKYRKLGKTGIKVSVLGFGAMRLPLKSNNPEDVNKKLTKQMIEYSVNNGINIFDTALLYHTSDRSKPGVSERLIGENLKQYQDEVHISTKMPSWNITSYDYFNQTLNHQLKSLQQDSIELFFIHSIKDSYYLKIRESGLYDFIEKALNDGRIEHVGFSTHGSIQLLDQILSDYDGWEFALTQINYIDNEENPGLAGLKKLHKLNIGTMIMEPLRGGQLAQNQPAQIQKIFDNSNREYTNIEWAFNYLWDKKEVNCVLSGMNNLNQVKENIKLAEKSDMGILSEKDRIFLEHIKEEYEKLNQIPCTSCNYCMPCPFGVDIPKCFKEYNFDIISGNTNESVQYKYHLHEDKKAHNCTECGKCITNCPQNIDIPKELKKLVEHF
jgi:predicted aldo/keto reductase-like oxidoreductase